MCLKENIIELLLMFWGVYEGGAAATLVILCITMQIIGKIRNFLRIITSDLLRKMVTRVVGARKKFVVEWKIIVYVPKVMFVYRKITVGES
jgi:hypothetical protein